MTVYELIDNESAYLYDEQVYNSFCSCLHWFIGSTFKSGEDGFLQCKALLCWPLVIVDPGPLHITGSITEYSVYL